MTVELSKYPFQGGNMRQKTILVSERTLLFAIAGQLFDQAPNRQPRKAEIIMQKVRDAFRADKRCNNDNEWYSMRLPEKEVYQFIYDLLFATPEFQELNLSQIEYENGVSVDDENRGKYSFVTRYDKYNSESWKSDFIDLDAFVRNAERMFWGIYDSEQDCFGCVNQPINTDSTLACGDSEKCKSCSINPNHTNNYESRRFPKGKYTFACKYDCPKSRYICCEECDDKDNCANRCGSKSDECGLAMHRRGI